MDPDGLLKVACPLWSFDARGWPDYLGTSTLLRVGPARLLTSCAHVIENTGGREMYFARSNSLERVVGEGGMTTLPSTGGRDADRVDCCFLRLTEQCADLMEELFAFATPAQVAVGQAATMATGYTFSGYPTNTSRPRGRARLRLDPFSITAGAMTRDDYASLGISHLTHVGIRMRDGPLTQADGKPGNKPDLNGISGGPIWMHFHEAIHAPEKFVPKIVGLCMENPKQRPDLLVGIRLPAVLAGIQRYFPDLIRFAPQDPDVEIFASRHGNP